MGQSGSIGRVKLLPHFAAPAEGGNHTGFGEGLLAVPFGWEGASAGSRSSALATGSACQRTTFPMRPRVPVAGETIGAATGRL